MCRFCNVLNENMEKYKPQEKSNTSYAYKVALATVNYVNKFYNGTKLQGNFELYYCPECGKKINDNNKEGE